MDLKASIHLPQVEVDPMRALWKRIVIAVLVLVAVVLIVWLDRDGYTDNTDGEVDLLDAIYYSTVSLSTTGYGDIVPVSDTARLANIVVITPLRVLFLIVLVGTTLEALTSRSRRESRINSWRKTLHDHTVVVGYGVKGRSAVATLRQNDVPVEAITVVDPSPSAVSEANEAGYVAILGDATRSDILRRAGADRAERVLVTTGRDDASVLVTLTVRQLNPTADIIVAVRESANVPLVRQGGATSVVTSSDAVGRILGMSSVSPQLGEVFDDLLTAGEGLEVAERDVTPREEGRVPRQIEDVVISVVRDGEILPYHSPAIGHLVRGDRIVVVRPAEALPWSPRSTEQARRDQTDDEDDPADTAPEE